MWTDSLGEARIMEDRLVNVARYSSGRLTERISYPFWGLRCGSAGYDAADIVSIREALQGGGDPAIAGLTPPPILIRLHPAGN